MSKVKTQDESGEKAAAPQSADERQEAPRKDDGPKRAARDSAVSSHAAQPARAAASRSLQRSVGNARAMRVMSEEHERARASRAVEERKASQAPDERKAARVQTLAVSHPEDASEREAETVARSVVAGRNAPPITPLSRAETQTLARREEKKEEAQREKTEEKEKLSRAEEKEKPAHREEKKAVAEPPPASRLAQRAVKEDDKKPQRTEDEKRPQLKDDEKKTRLKEDEKKPQRAEDEKRARPSEEEKPRAAMRLEAEAGGGTNVAAAEDAIARKSAGSPVNPSLRRALEPRMGADLSAARVHQDSSANEAAGALNARAFAHGNDIYLARGESENDTRLMAHELTHVVQQTGATAPRVNRAPQPSGKPEETAQKKAPAGTKTPAAADGEVAPGFVELKGMAQFKPPTAVDSFLEGGKEATVEMRYGALAKGPVKVSRSSKSGKESYTVRRQPIALNHPAFSRVAELFPGLGPCLVVQVEGREITGSIGFAAEGKLPLEELSHYIEKGPELLGLAGFTFPSLPQVTNKLDGGQLRLGLSGVSFRLGAAFSGTLSFEAVDDNVPTFEGSADIAVPKLATGKLDLKRSPEGLVTGKVTLALTLPKNFTGGLDVTWDGRAVTGEGKVGYTGEKLSGEVVLRLTEREEAEQLEREKKAPPDAAKQSAAQKPAGETKDKGKGKKIDYVVFGEGDLTFAFNEWLNGTAHVIVDQKGFVTIIGKITPQKEFELFEQTDFVKPLFKLEARAAYGIPVVGNIFIFANVGMDAFAKLGPAKFYNIVVEGTYSTDPEKNKDFSIKGSINISAAAGLRLTLKAGVGLEILGHDIKAGAGLSGIAGIKAYAEATPTIGYREKGAPGEDKKGDFFIRGDLEIAAQPFLGLSGDLFVEIDAPWWSPVPDKKWTWPLFNKEYPIGGSFGMLASVDYVFGSKQLPSIEFKPVDFSADKFMTDLYTDKVKSKSAEGGDQKGEWKEKNTKDGEVPTGGGKGDAKPGDAGEQTAPKSTEQSGGGGGKGGKKDVDPNATTADGKKVEEHKKKALEQGKKDPVKDLKTGEATEKKPEDQKGKETEDHEKKWERGTTAVKQALAYAEKTGIDLKELNQILKSIRKQTQFGFTELYAEPGKEDWVVKGSMSAAKEVTHVKKSAASRPPELVGKDTPRLDELSEMPNHENVHQRYVDGYKANKYIKDDLVAYLEKRAAKKLGRLAEGPGIELYNLVAPSEVSKNTKLIETLKGDPPDYEVEMRTIPDFFERGKVIGDVKRVQKLSRDPQMRAYEWVSKGEPYRMKDGTEVITEPCRFDLVVRAPSDDLLKGTDVSGPLEDTVKESGGLIYAIL